MSDKELDNQIEITLKDGSKVLGEIVFEFAENGDQFVVYGIDDVLYAAKYDENNELSPVEEDEWPLVERIINEYIETNGKEVE